jgi:outer membrane receptor protein involved in Fe transport
MDRNAADVVKRIPGVTVMDDRFIMVRGLYDRYNSVWLNDASAPSSEVDKKSFSFDIIPSGQIDRILIAKTPAPELPGDFAGGMVKVYTMSIPDKNTYTASYQISSRENQTGTQFNYAQKSKTDWLGYDNGLRSMPSGLPDKVNKTSPTQDNIAISKSFKNTWAPLSKTQGPDSRFSFSAANVFRIKGVRIGNTLAVNYSNTSTNIIKDRMEWDSVTLQKHATDNISENKVSTALMDNLAVAWGNNKIEFKNLYNQLGKSGFLYRTNAVDTLVTSDERTYNMSYESRAIYSTQLMGTHKSSDDKRKYIWAFGYADMFKNIPDLRRIRYTKNPGEADSMYVAAVPAGAPDLIYGGGRVYSQLYEKNYSFSHNFTQALRIANYEFEVSAGNFLELKKRAFNMRSFGYSLQPGPNSNTFKHLSIDQIFDESHLGGTGNFKVDEGTNDYDHYDATNKLLASYVALKLPVGTKFTAYGGVRDEYNTYQLIAVDNGNTLNPLVKTNFILPSLNLSYNITDKQLLRVAYGKTLNRPEFKENSPFYFYDLENRWAMKGAMRPSLVHKTGDTLDVTQIHNIDARWEWYPSPTEVIQVGVFYKSFKDPIQQVITVGGIDSREFSYDNLEKAYSYGLEIDVKKNLMFFDDMFKSNFFKDISFVGNAAFIKSEVTAKPALKIDKAPMQGQSPYMYNAGLYYQGDKTGIQASLLYNVYGPRIYLLGSTLFSTGSIWDLPFHSMDFIASKKITKYLMVSFGVQNLLNSAMKQAQDVNFDNKISTNFKDASNPDRQFISYKPGRYYTFGIKVKI